MFLNTVDPSEGSVSVSPESEHAGELDRDTLSLTATEPQVSMCIRETLDTCLKKRRLMSASAMKLSKS